MKPAQWLRVAAAWLLRAATICSSDGRNISLLTPGFPVSYRGQWMRDSYYGVSGGADVLPNATATREAAEWMYEHARPGDNATFGKTAHARTHTHTQITQARN